MSFRFYTSHDGTSVNIIFFAMHAQARKSTAIGNCFALFCLFSPPEFRLNHIFTTFPMCPLVSLPPKSRTNPILSISLCFLHLKRLGKHEFSVIAAPSYKSKLHWGFENGLRPWCRLLPFLITAGVHELLKESDKIF